MWHVSRSLFIIPQWTFPSVKPKAKGVNAPLHTITSSFLFFLCNHVYRGCLQRSFRYKGCETCRWHELALDHGRWERARDPCGEIHRGCGCLFEFFQPAIFSGTANWSLLGAPFEIQDFRNQSNTKEYVANIENSLAVPTRLIVLFEFHLSHWNTLFHPNLQLFQSKTLTWRSPILKSRSHSWRTYSQNKSRENQSLRVTIWLIMYTARQKWILRLA